MKTPGQALVEQLNEALPPGVVWTKIERVTLGRIEVLADRLDALGKRADAAIADPDTSASKVSMLANVARQYEVSMHALIKSLDPTMEVQAKSARHRDTAMKRWHGSAS